ncbi:hypothetical protein UFOVP273_60 [uncultured Caudovirales phage]|uniref:Uncharacterized protein n=1 Tax=uncultured Caudovirales phage TaxID=2100421 RepID=A0A6J5LII3_9CAUD|nr:hypothetical protein UFOVP273_60 [uncultured Caudovirales phage]
MAKVQKPANVVTPPSNPIRNPITPLNQVNPNVKDQDMVNPNLSKSAAPMAGFQPGWPTGGSAPAIPVPQNTESLPLLQPTAGYTDTGVGHSGDLGGAGPR